MKTKPSILIGVSLIVVSLVLGYQSFSQYIFGPKNRGTFESSVASKADYKLDTTKLVSGRPVSIEINSVAIKVKVVDGLYDYTKKDWSLNEDKAQYATITPLSNNQSGNTFIYGHNNANVFINLPKIKVGDQAIVKTDNGRTFKYTFRSSIETKPEDDSLFRYQGPSILTLQTCSGIRSQNRQLFTFDFKEVV